jgi:hypothetical protein
MKVRLSFILTILLTQIALAQKGTITGRVYDEINNDPLPFANVVISGTTIGTTTDANGKYTLQIEPGLYNVEASFVGYAPKTEFEVQVSLSKPRFLDFALSEDQAVLEAVEINAQNKFQRKAESPVSLNSLGINEIQRNPGGNQDISKVIQALPGVASTPNFRNDIIIRGGGPNENKFFLDGIEIPAINHFATQGSSGGPVGLINVNFIREADLYTSAFPVEKATALSSVLDLKLKDGRTDKTGGIFQVGASEVGLTLEGPLSEKTTYIASVRRSYLQFLFSALDLSFLPTYNDFQFKVKYNIDKKNQITFLGLGAIDQFKLNLDANETEAQRYQLQVLPVNEQWNYSVGAKYTRFGEKSYTNFILSRFMLNNTAEKFLDNDESNPQLLDYASQEIENKLRIENFRRQNNWRITTGFGFEEAKYNVQQADLQQPAGSPAANYSSDLRLLKYSAFGSATRAFFKDRLSATLALRFDGNTFNEQMANPLNQFSPKLAFSYDINGNLSFNTSISQYNQLPPYTSLGFRNNLGTLVNEDLDYIRAQHYVAGFTYYLPFSAKVSIEGFFKNYQQYPFLLRDSITLANLGGDFGVIGNQPATSSAEGRAYGLEFLYQQKLYKGFFGTLAYTLVKSEFEDQNGAFVPSAWDNQHIITATAGKKFGKNWELGVQYQFLGGSPYTPIDVAGSSLVAVYDNNQRGLPDYARLNSLRFDNFNRLNVRIDKKWFFNRISLDVYLDIQNALGQSISGVPVLVLQRDAQGDPIVIEGDPNDPSDDRYATRFLENDQGTLIPSIGIIVQF